MTVAVQNRTMGSGLAFLLGLVVGVGSYLLAELLIPSPVASSTKHDILLANRLGFIYTPVVGLWLGWLQRSWWRAVAGMLVGIGIGFIYLWLCASQNFLAIMVGFPTLLGSILAAAVGSNRSRWLLDLGLRLGKGLVAGLVLGFVYMVVLNVAAAMVMGLDENPVNFTSRYVMMMWRCGPIALGIASALFFVLIRWAVGLTRVKLLVFEETETVKGQLTETRRFSQLP